MKRVLSNQSGGLLAKVTTGLMFFLLIGLSACGTAFDEPVSSSPSQSDPPKTSYGKMAHLMSDTANEAVDTVGKYVDLDTMEERGLEGDGIESLGQLLPNDLTTLKRKVGPEEGRAVDAGTEVTLDQELKEIKKEFDAKVEAIMPDPTPAKTLPGVEIDQESIKVGDDQAVPLKSLSGVAMVEVMNAMANGGDPEKTANDMQKDVSPLADGEPNSERGLYLYGQRTWSNNTVNYMWWGSMKDVQKQALHRGMNTWTESTSGRVRFREFFKSDGWIMFLIGIGSLDVVYYHDASVPRSSAGDLAYLHFSLGILTLNRDLTEATQLDRTVLHELGHVLGLKHEQQRADRDSFVIVPEGDSNNALIKQHRSDFSWCSYTIKIWRKRFTIWYPCFWKRTHSVLTGDFDYNSIMLYPRLEIRNPDANCTNGVRDINGVCRTRPNNTLSATDVNTILRLY
jgi:hypothetical protein